MFDRLLKPKWQHPDPRKRRAALETGQLPPDALATLAREDQDAAVRCAAIQRLEDLNLLLALLQTKPVAEVCEAVEKRQQALLSRPLEQSPSLEERLAIIRRLDSNRVCGFLARHADSIEIRSAALEQLTDTQQLCAVAIEDPVAAVRRKALERIDDPAGWEIVSRDARNKDKQISRTARERLEAFRQARADQQTAAQLCAEMQTLLEASNLQTDAQARFQQLCTRWDRLAASLPAELETRFANLRQQLAVKVDAFEAVLNERRQICSELERLLEQIRQGQEATADFAAQLNPQREGLAQRWQATAPTLQADDLLTQRFAALQQQLHQEAQRITRDSRRIGAQRQLIARAEAALQQPDRLDDKRIKELQQRWQQLEKAESQRLQQVMQDEFDSVLNKVREQLNHQMKQRKKALDEAERLLPELETALQQGELERALSLRDRITHRLKKSKGAAEPRRRVVQQHLHAMHDSLEEMRQWRHWGSGHAREHLCHEIEELIGSPLSPDEIASKVRTARKAWQRIDQAEGPAEESLWERFDKACTSAYEPYQQERQKQEAILQQHLGQKQQLCAELEAFERDTDWENIADWREVDQQVHKARERWRRIGGVPRKAGKPLEKSYHAVLDRLEQHLAPERERELRRRRLLIARVEELAKSPDLRGASREVKEAQEQWKPTVPLPRKEEQALWQAFRGACDKVFDQLREQREAADAERQANLAHKQNLCTELESLLDQPELSFPEIHKRFDAASEVWQEIGEIPRKQSSAIEARFEAIKQRLAERQQQEAKAARDAEMAMIRERSRLCERLEQGALDGVLEASARQDLLQEIRQTWEALPALEASYAKPLEARYSLACRALEGDQQAQEQLQLTLVENLQQRLQLCLQMEVTAGVDSPPEYADRRMEYQVSLLSEALHQKFDEEQSRSEKLRDLQIDWLLAGPVQGEERDNLEGRVARVFESARQATAE
jgi:hypothetical protein